ncbi:MAG: hypothetical protein ACRBFS_06250 [Aureispira sp.]
MEEVQYYENIFHLSVPYPLPILQFLKQKMQLGKRYAIMEVHTHNGQWSKLLLNHVHLVCSLCTDPSYQVYLKEQLADASNFLSLNALPILTNIDDDSIDCLFIDDTFGAYEVAPMQQEFQRILRLNSYVLLTYNERFGLPNSFTSAYLQLLQTKTAVPTTKLPQKERLNSFYEHSYGKEVFNNQQRLTWVQLEQYFLTQLEEHDLTASATQIQALRLLFEAHRTDDKVIMSYKTHLYYGLFNYSVSAISLRKNIFFNLLRPFAFVFYILLKANIYFWKGIRRLRGVGSSKNS